MKFQCERCKTRYSIADEKVRGKILKIRCKNCSSVITVKEGMDIPGPTAEEAAAAVAATKPAATSTKAAAGGSTSRSGAAAKGAGNAPANGLATNGHARAADKGAQAQSPVLEEAFNRAMSRLPTPPPATEDDDSTRVGTVPVPPGDDEPADEWFVSVDGEQEGPFTLRDAQKRVGKKLPHEDMFSWHDGFDDWLPVAKVPELAPHIPAPRPARPASKQMRAVAPPMPAAAAPVQASAGLDSSPFPAPSSSRPMPLAAPEFVAKAASAPARVPLFPDPAPSPPLRSPFDDEEKSDVQGLSLAALAAGATSTPAADDDDKNDKDDGSFDFDIGEASRVIKLNDVSKMMPPSGAASRATGTRPALGARNGTGAVASLPGAAPRGSGGATALPLGVDDVNASAVLQPLPKRTRRKMGLYVAVGSGLLAVVVVLLIVLLHDGGGTTEQADSRQSSKFVNNFYDEGGGIGGGFRGITPGKKKPDEVVPQPLPEDPGRKGTMKPVVIKKPVNPTDPNPKNPVDPQHPINPRVEDDPIDDPTGPSEALEAQDVVDMYGRNQGMVTRCYDQELKVTPDFKPGRVEVTIVISKTGVVTGVEAPGTGSQRFSDCLKRAITSWRFRKSAAGLKMVLPLSFKSR